MLKNLEIKHGTDKNSIALSHRLAIPDGFIAATAIENDVELFTLNKKDFRFIEGLKLYQ